MTVEARIGALERELRELRREAASSGAAGRGPVLSFRLGEALFALELSAMVEVLRMVSVTPLSAEGALLLGVVNYRGRVLPVLDPSKRLGLAVRAPGLESKIVVLSDLGYLYGLVVDEVDGIVEAAPIDLSAVGGFLPAAAGEVPACIGGTVRDGAKVLALLDPSKLFEAEERRLVEQALEANP
ncbi:MAG: chemotaxis protein CheW [Myxococcaceae bacterium]